MEVPPPALKDLMDLIICFGVYTTVAVTIKNLSISNSTLDSLVSPISFNVFQEEAWGMWEK